MSALLRGKISKPLGDFYCLNYLYSFKIKKQLTSSERAFENKDFEGIVIPSQGNTLLDFNQHQKFDKNPCIFFEDFESPIYRIDSCKTSSKILTTTKSGGDISRGFSSSSVLTYDVTKNKYEVKTLCICLR